MASLGGSTPPPDTELLFENRMPPSSNGLGRWPFKPEMSVRIRQGVLKLAGVAELADAPRSNRGELRAREGSSPSAGTRSSLSEGSSMQLRLDSFDETPESTVKQVRCGSKHHKREINGRVGRLHRAEKKYRNQKDHSGKGTTLRSHRF